VPDTPAELRATSDALLRDLEVLATLEDEKRGIPPNDPRVAELADRIEDIARRLLARSATQKELADQLADSGAGAVPIEAVERSPSAVLAEWRDIERRLARAEPGSAERTELEILAERVREEYAAAYEARRSREAR